MRGVKSLSAVLLFVAPLLVLGCSSAEERISQHRERANEYFEKEQWNEAKIEFFNLLQAASNDADAHYKMASSTWRSTPTGSGSSGKRCALIRRTPSDDFGWPRCSPLLAATRRHESTWTPSWTRSPRM